MKRIIILFCLFLPLYSFADWVNVGAVCTGGGPTCESLAAGSPWRTRYWRACNPSSWGDEVFCDKWPSGSPCEDGKVWNQGTQTCDVSPEYCEALQGEDAGIVENSPTPPGYELICYSGCAVEASEFFQRTDNNNWVIAYRYTGQVCGPGDPLSEPDLPPGEEGPPALNPNQPSDTDDDGTPDSNDGDTDGDGIPNSTDTDDDGDGIADEDDPSPNGPGQQEQPSAANVALNCEQSPACTGDAIQCAQLVELWRLRCVGGGETEQVDEGLSGEIVGDVSDTGTAGLDVVEDAIADSLDDPSGIEMPSTFSNFLTTIYPNPSCSDLSFNWMTGTFLVPCSKTAELRTLMAYVMFIVTVIYLYHLAIRPVGE